MIIVRLRQAWIWLPDKPYKCKFERLKLDDMIFRRLSRFHDDLIRDARHFADAPTNIMEMRLMPASDNIYTALVGAQCRMAIDDDHI